MKYSNMDLAVGDIVRKANGKITAEVIEKPYQGSSTITVKWETGRKETFHNDRYARWVKVNEEGQTPMSEELYEINVSGEVKIAKKLMEKTPNLWIMEVKGGSNEVLVVGKQHIKEILPYTIKVLIDGKEVHYRVEDEKSFNVDDLFIMGKTLSLARVIAINTENKSCRGVFRPFAKILVDKDYH